MKNLEKYAFEKSRKIVSKNLIMITLKNENEDMLSNGKVVAERNKYFF